MPAPFACLGCYFMFKLQGILPPIATPFDHKGDLYKIKVQHNVEKWNRTGLAGYVVCGSTGESVMLTTEEKIQLWEWVAQWASPQKLLIAGTGVYALCRVVLDRRRLAAWESAWNRTGPSWTTRR